MSNDMRVYKPCKSFVYEDCNCPVHICEHDTSWCYCVMFHEGQTNDTECRYYKPKEDNL